MLPAVRWRSWRRILSGEDPAAPLCHAVPKPYLEMLIDPFWDRVLAKRTSVITRRVDLCGGHAVSVCFKGGLT
jgi:hypothetical protein